MDKKKYHKNLFRIAALWNWSVSIPVFFIYKSMFFLFGMHVPGSSVWLYGFLGAICIFGIGYYMISVNPKRNKDIVILGIIGKSSIFIYFCINYIAGNIHMLLLFLGCVDLAFAFLFYRALKEL